MFLRAYEIHDRYATYDPNDGSCEVTLHFQMLVSEWDKFQTLLDTFNVYGTNYETIEYPPLLSNARLITQILETLRENNVSAQELHHYITSLATVDKLTSGFTDL